jgi:hypothetical protein
MSRQTCTDHEPAPIESEPSAMSEWDTTYGRFLRAVAMIGAIVGTLILGVLQIQFIYHVGFDFWKELVRDHFPATLGLQGAAIISFGVVIFLR